MIKMCLVCGERSIAKICSCGFDLTKEYDEYRTLTSIPKNSLSTYEKRKRYGNKEQRSSEPQKHSESNAIPENQNGREKNKDLQKYKKEAEQGNVEAMYWIAKFNYDGCGISEDYEEAFHWYQKAAENGYTEAMYRLGDLYYEGIGANVDTKKAFYWYKKAADLGHCEAMYVLGNLYTVGIGVNTDLYEAFSWYMKAADAGHADAMVNVGRLYYLGQGIIKNDEASQTWLRRAAEKGSGIARSNMWNYFKVHV